MVAAVAEAGVAKLCMSDPAKHQNKLCGYQNHISMRSPSAQYPPGSTYQALRHHTPKQQHGALQGWADKSRAWQCRHPLILQSAP